MVDQGPIEDLEAKAIKEAQEIAAELGGLGPREQEEVHARPNRDDVKKKKNISIFDQSS